MTENIYPTEQLKCWGKAKELREKYYRDYATAHETGGVRWAGGANNIDPILLGLGDDVHGLTGEPYGATVAVDRDFAARCHQAVEEKGYKRDVCAYMRNYWGSILIDEFVFGGPFPKPDFLWQFHVCCSHAKWYEEVARIEKDVPYYCTDLSAGFYYEWDEALGQYQPAPKDYRIQYVVDQLQEGIEWLEKVTGRKYDDEKLIKAAYNYFESLSLWAEICVLNKAVPAPLDEKTMFSLYVFSALQKSKDEYVEFFRELRDEVQDRVDRGIAALANEKARIMSDIQPPWGFLSIFRYLEDFGCVSVGSYYTFCLMGMWQIEKDGTLNARETPQSKGIVLKDREQTLKMLADWMLSQFMSTLFYTHKFKSDIMIKIAEQWKCIGAIMHYNRGCEGLTLGVAENRMALMEAGIPVVSYEGNMGDEREFDLAETQGKIDAFMESLGLK
ncbi:MAG: benzoyl-CoA reductase, bzd-type, subunit O [Thermodesulfobacteriota bacterium]|nr:benzoyl-CoA reductase, bzd-type, subunit O [Thermodesulfobacteriota bacterium]